MYNTKYKCVKPIKVWNENKEIRIPRNSIWQLVWCGGQKSMKEFTGIFNKKPMTLILPDCHVEKHFKKI